MKMFLTRMGKSAKFIITGDPGQIDLPRKQVSGLKESLLALKDIDGIAQVYLDDKDVVRHRLVKRIITAYKSIETSSISAKIQLVSKLSLSIVLCFLMKSLFLLIEI